ncbi:MULTISPECIES: hypothetical protein [Actinoplanes]|uniref:hypothetical protein n=1 Tax=Actinoplanes TaxID=1865 RepID=UPI0005F2DF0C|nr:MULTISPECIES: hypothetical protein [Actinoplanes]GLY00951.1 hypothetical protein Acsp01_13300 [Actinoplanes sp. NBRC 101535]
MSRAGRTLAQRAAGVVSMVGAIEELDKARLASGADERWPALVAGVLLLAGGLVFVLWRRLTPPVKPVLAAAVAAAVAATAAGTLYASSSVCCMYSYGEGRGWPFFWLGRGASADDPETARLLAEANGWALLPDGLLGNVVVGAYAGMIVMVVISVARRSKSGRKVISAPGVTG